MFAQRPSQSSPTRSSSITYFFPFSSFCKSFQIFFTRKKGFYHPLQNGWFLSKIGLNRLKSWQVVLIKALSPPLATMSTAFQWLTCISHLNAKVKPHCRVIMFNNAVNISNILQRLTVEICKMLSAVNNSPVFSMTRKPVQCITKEPRNNPV